jgi:hypothetical protein
LCTPDIRFYFGVYLEGLRKSTRNFKIVGVPAEIETRYSLNPYPANVENRVS